MYFFFEVRNDAFRVEASSLDESLMKLPLNGNGNVGNRLGEMRQERKVPVKSWISVQITRLFLPSSRGTKHKSDENPLFERTTFFLPKIKCLLRYQLRKRKTLNCLIILYDLPVSQRYVYFFLQNVEDLS